MSAAPSDDADGRRSRRKVAFQYTGLIAGLLALSVAMWWRVWITGDPAATISCQCGDPAQYLWLVEWVPWSIAHLHNPFLSQAIYAGQGGSNTLELSDLLPQLAVSPVTEIFGPIAAFNVLVTLVPVVNGWSMFVLLRKVTRFAPGQLIASLLYGFSPYVVHDVPFGHFNIDVLFFPPLAMWCLYDLLVTGRHRPAVVGVLLGMLTVAQFFTGPELLAMSAVVALAGTFAVLVLSPRLVVARLRPLATGIGTAAAVASAALAYPLWFVLAGPRHVVGVPWPGTPLYGYRWGSLLHASSSLPSPLFGQFGGYYGSGPAADFLGAGLLVALAASAVLWWRRRLAWVVAAMGTGAWALSIGIGMSGSTAWPPWRIFYHLPVVSEITPGRFALFSDFAAAVLLAVSLDLFWERRQWIAGKVTRRAGHPGRYLDCAWGGLCCAAALGVLVPLAVTYRTYAIHDNPVPRWFQVVAPKLPAGDVLLVMPDAASGFTQAMAWQADDRFVYAMIGGEAQVPGRDGRHSIHVDPPTGAEALVDDLSFGIGSEPDISPGQVRAVRRALTRWGVGVVVVTLQTRFPPYAVGFMTEVLGRAPIWQEGSWVWYGLGPDPPLQVAAAALRGCARAASGAPLGVPACVLAHARPPG